MPFSIILKGQPTVPVIAHIPHSSTFVPEDIRQSILLNDVDLKKELLLMTDSLTAELFASIADLGGIALVNNFSRLVVDSERFEND